MSENMTQLLEKLAAVTVERDALAAELAKLRAAPVVAAPAGFIPTPFIPDADTRRNDEAFAAQQTVPSVPDEWREKPIAEFPLFNDEGLCQEKHHCEWALQQDRKRLHALLQSYPQAPAAPMQRNLPGDRCEICGAVEVAAMSPRTKYACGSSDYDKRPGTFKQGDNCRALLQSAEVNHD